MSSCAWWREPSWRGANTPTNDAPICADRYPGAVERPSQSTMRTVAGTAVCLTVAVLVLAGCGAKQDNTGAAKSIRTVSLALDEDPNADHAGLYTAIDQGEFKAVGLKVKATTPADSAAPLRQLAAEQVDLAIASQPQILIAREKRLPVVVVAAIVRQEAAPRDGQKDERNKKQPARSDTDETDEPTYDRLAFVANENVIKENPEWIHLFLAAWARGTRAAEKSPQLAVRALRRANSKLETRIAERSVKTVLPALVPNNPARAIGFIDVPAWERYMDWMVATDRLKRRVDISKALTNRFL